MTTPPAPSAAAPEADDLILWEVLEQHLDEAEFQADNFEYALDSAVYTLDTLGKGPERFLLAHIDALLIGGKPVIDRLIVPVVEEPDPTTPGRLVAAAWVLIAAGRFDLFGKLLFHAEPGVRRAAARAGGLAANQNADRWVLARFGADVAPTEICGLLNYAAACRLAPPGPLFAWLQHTDATVVAAAVRAAAAADPMAHGAVFEWLLEHPDRAVRAEALFPSLLTGSPKAWVACERAALKDEAPSLTATSLYAALGGPAHHGKLAARLPENKARLACLYGLAFSGNVDLVPGLLPWLATGEPVTVKLVAQAIAAITGVDLDSPALRAGAAPPKAAPNELPPADEDPEAQAALPPLEDDDLDTPPVPPPELALPDPNPAGFDTWWRESGGGFKSGVRHLGGKPLSPAAAADFLARAPLRLRHPVAQSIAIRSQGEVRLDTRAFSFVQTDELAAVKALPASRLHGKFHGW